MLLVLHPNPSMDLVKALLWHDGGERWVGDMPAPAKWYDALLGEVYDRAELSALQTWEMYDGFLGMKDEDYQWLNAIDRIELWLWCHDQLHMGNEHIREFIVHLEISFHNATKAGRMPEPCARFLKNYKWTRLPEVHRLDHQT
jgi:5'-deoxynucleotidase YfbR-like HD superfamily hydrolase